MGLCEKDPTLSLPLAIPSTTCRRKASFLYTSAVSAVVTLIPCRSGTLRPFPVAAVILLRVLVFLARKLPRSLGSAAPTQAEYVS